jgi:hypothetical protein
MAKYKCPFPECTYETEDVEDSLIRSLERYTHANSDDNTTDRQGRKSQTSFNLSRRILRRVVYFLSRWKDYTEATKIKGKDEVIQLLGCCDEQLRKDLTRNAGGSLVNQPAD